MTDRPLEDQEPSWLVRALEWFEKDPGDAFVGSVQLHGLSLRELQRLWGRPPDDPMVDMYAVDETHSSDVAEWAGMPLDLGRFDYFLACYTRDWSAAQRAGGYMGQFPPPRALPAFPDAESTKPGSV
jgi:hypothetical protein